MQSRKQDARDVVAMFKTHHKYQSSVFSYLVQLFLLECLGLQACRESNESVIQMVLICALVAKLFLLEYCN